MRVLFAIALLVFGIAGVSAAGAADMAIDRSGSYSAYGQRAEQLVIYDYQPGVLVRAYWLAPWRHHHYFPATGQQPWIGRDEDLSAPSEPSPPAKTFRRSWSNSSAFEHELPRARPLPVDTEPAPRIERFEPNPGPLK
jgi:hypothetical protein